MIPPFLRMPRRKKTGRAEEVQPEADAATAMQSIRNQMPNDENRKEIEGEIDNLKRSDRDKRFRGMWYEAARQRPGVEKDDSMRGVKRMGICKELKRLGYEFDHDYGNSEDRAEVWVNRETGRGVMIEWFSLPEVAR